MDDILFVWFSELNYLMTDLGCDSLDELEIVLWWKYGKNLMVL